MNEACECKIQRDAWPYFVLITGSGCQQIGMMRWRLLKEAKDAAMSIAEQFGVRCIVFGRNNKEVFRA